MAWGEDGVVLCKQLSFGQIAQVSWTHKIRDLQSADGARVGGFSVSGRVLVGSFSYEQFSYKQFSYNKF